MKQYIDKSALVAELERRIKETKSMQPKFDQFWAGQISAFKGVLKILDTLEVKEVDSLPQVWDRETLDEYAYQVAYDLSHDWMRDEATWDDVQTAVKLGAKWQKENGKKEESV